MKTILLTSTACLALGASFAAAATLEVDQERSRIQVDAKATGHNFTGNLGKYKIEAEGDEETCKPTALSLLGFHRSGHRR